MRNNFDDSFIFTIFFLTLGPIKIIPAFARLTAKADSKFKKDLAIKGALVATVICLAIALLGGGIVEKYRLTTESIQIAGGTVLLISALRIIFPSIQPENTIRPNPTPLQLAISPLATPIIVPSVGIAAILVAILFAQEHQEMLFTVYKAIFIMMILDFLVMYFVDKVLKIPGLMAFLQIAGSVLVFIQVALAIQTILYGLARLGLIKK